MDHEEMLMKRVMETIKAKHGEAYKRNFKREIVVPESDFPRIPFEKAKAIIRENYKYSGEKDYDFDRREEELIGLYARKELGSDFVFVTDYPFEARPFYHMVDEEGKTLSFDLLYRGIEITTGAQREHRIDVLEKQAKAKGIDLESLDFYLEFFRYGMPPHGGFGFGLTRFMMKLFDVDSIRDVTYLYRGPNRITP
jgi:aspartyl-tRNA synthetase